MKRLVVISFWLITISFILSFSGCAKNEITENPYPFDYLTNNDEPITYQTHIKLLIENNCKGCHSPSPLNVLPYLTNYDEVKLETEQGTLLSTVLDNDPRAMPPDKPLTKQEKDMLIIWANNNFPN